MDGVPMKSRILVIDDDSQQRRFLAAVLEASAYVVVADEDAEAALARLERDAEIDLALVDLQMPGMGGIAFVEALRARGSALPVIVLTADGSVSRAVEAIRAGALDFLIKPVGPERLETSIRNALSISHLSTEVRRLSMAGENRLAFDDLVSVADSTRRMIALARRAARSEIPILIGGESGTGKEVFARAIHGSSGRSGAPFVAVNCGALPAQLVESLLFGHEKGAFTGATERRPGKFMEASGGTLFLDEIGELPLESQVKLLRVLQTGEIDPVGAKNPVRVDIRLISATNRDLAEMIADGRFREDLYYRISVFPLALPPLRERREDVPALARMFLRRFATVEGVPVEGFAHDAIEAIVADDWPGNVRQLENTIYRAVVMADGALIRAADLHNSGVRSGSPAARASSENQTGGAVEGVPERTGTWTRPDGHIKRLVEIEGEAITQALALYRGRMSEAARRLGIGRSTLYRKIDELKIEKP